MTNKALTDSDNDISRERADEQCFPHWRRNLWTLPPANLLTSMGFALSFPFLPLMVSSLGGGTSIWKRGSAT